jgi:hypothetical protein
VIGRWLQNVWRDWRSDRRGAAAVQFIAILPVFIVIVIGLWAVFSVYSARDAICDATREAGRFLQVEGPLHPEDEFLWPADWEAEARTIVESELKKENWYELTPVDQSEVKVYPQDQRPQAPRDMRDVTADNVPQSWFFVRVTKRITNPLAIFLPSGSGNGPTMQISCQATAFYEGPPIGPTAGPVRPPRVQCPPVGPCGPGGLPATSTPCPRGQTCDPTPCPPCQP